ncbi:MAG TPA: hypothetical protein VF193_13255, partial [Steroidobacter sp.]
RRPSRQHTAHALQFEITVHYRFHPRHRERLGVVKTQTYRGERAYVIEQRDGSLTLLPAWMAEPEAAKLHIVSQPRISHDALISLRRIVDAAVSSRAGMARDGGEHERSEAAAEKPAAC